MLKDLTCKRGREGGGRGREGGREGRGREGGRDDYSTAHFLYSTFPIMEVHFPKYSTREIHRNYIDCVRWFGRLAFSKSCENSLILWRPPRPEDKPDQKPFQVLQK